MCKRSRLHVRVLEAQREKYRVRSLSTISDSFTVSLCLANSPTFIKKSRKHTNCPLSRSCLLFAGDTIIGPCLLAYTCTNTCVGTSASTSMRVEDVFCIHVRCPHPHESLPHYSHVFVKLPVSSTITNMMSMWTMPYCYLHALMCVYMSHYPVHMRKG